MKVNDSRSVAVPVVTAQGERLLSWWLYPRPYEWLYRAGVFLVFTIGAVVAGEIPTALVTAGGMALFVVLWLVARTRSSLGTRERRM